MSDQEKHEAINTYLVWAIRKEVNEKILNIRDYPKVVSLTLEQRHKLVNDPAFRVLEPFNAE